jgi:hypothetical protein
LIQFTAQLCGRRWYHRLKKLGAVLGLVCSNTAVSQ